MKKYKIVHLGECPDVLQPQERTVHFHIVRYHDVHTTAMVVYVPAALAAFAATRPVDFSRLDTVLLRPVHFLLSLVDILVMSRQPRPPSQCRDRAGRSKSKPQDLHGLRDSGCSVEQLPHTMRFAHCTANTKQSRM